MGIIDTSEAKRTKYIGNDGKWLCEADEHVAEGQGEDFEDMEGAQSVLICLIKIDALFLGKLNDTDRDDYEQVSEDGQ